MKTKFFCAICATTALVSATAAYGQDQTPADEPQTAGENEIIVTAQRRSERSVDVPISITAVSADQLAKASITSFEGLERLSPGTRISRTGVFVNPAIRGITSSIVGPGQENNTALYIDGFYQPETLAIGADFANVSNIQVLKGPQGTLYGRNAVAGAILISTREPTLGEFVGDADASYGSRDDVRLRAFTSVPLGSQAAFSVGGYHRRNDGYIKDTSGVDSAPFKDDEIRAKLKIEPADNFKVVLGYNYIDRTDGSASSSTLIAYESLGASIPLPPVGPDRSDTPDISSQNPEFPKLHYKYQEALIAAELDLGAVKASSHTAWQYGDGLIITDSDFTKVPVTKGISHLNPAYFSQAFDLTLDVAPNLDLLVGALYFNAKTNIHVDAFSFGSQVVEQTASLSSEAIAGYADATWEVTPGLFLSGGLRYSTEKRTVQSRYLRLISGPVDIVIAPPTSKRFSALTPRMSVRYEISPYSNVYASYTKGFKSGTFNSTGASTATVTPPIDQESIDAYEAGYKFGRHGINFSAAAFYYDYKNLQVSVTLTNPISGGITNLINNAASAEIYGAEASLGFNIGDSFNVTLGGAYTHARYKSFPNASASVPVGGTISTITQDFSGRRIARAPDWTFSATASKTIPIGDANLQISANGSYASANAPSSEAYDPVTGKNLYYNKGYFMGSAQATLTLPGDKISIGAFVENITDKRFTIINAANVRGQYVTLNEPRRIGVKVGIKY